MAGSTLKELVNKVLRTTGDLDELGNNDTVSNTAGGIGKRIVDFFNLVISDIEKSTNWDFLYSLETIDVIAPTSEVVSQDIYNGISVSVTLSGKAIVLKELTISQLLEVRLQLSSQSGVDFFARRSDPSTGTMTMMFVTELPIGSVVNVSGYRRARTFDTLLIDDTATCDFDDTIVVYGVLAQLDSFDQLNRGYSSMYASQLTNSILFQNSNKETRVTVESY